jgi:U3 small nucleolar RNA-associated protein 21
MIQSVYVSACGNFGIAGSSTGVIYMWNLQSGIQRKSFNVGPAPEDVAKRGFGSKKKDRTIVGLASDVLDRVLVACTLDGTLNVHLASLSGSHSNFLFSSLISIIPIYGIA